MEFDRIKNFGRTLREGFRRTETSHRPLPSEEFTTFIGTLSSGTIIDLTDRKLAIQPGGELDIETYIRHEDGAESGFYDVGLPLTSTHLAYLVNKSPNKQFSVDRPIIGEKKS